jgi:allantoinase
VTEGNTADRPGRAPPDDWVTMRPAQARWPDGMRVALWPVINIESYPVGKPGPSLQPHLSRGLDAANYGWRAYGNEAGIWRILELSRELALPFTAAVNSVICDSHPAVIESVIAHGWDVIGHGRDNVTRQHDMPAAAEHSLVREAVACLESVTGQAIAGWLTPGFDIGPQTFSTLRSLGITYTADLTRSDQPAWIDTEHGPLLAVPYSLETNDISLFLGLHCTPDEYVQAITAQVRQLASEPARTVAALGLHPFIIGQPGRIGAFRECIERLRSVPGVWLTTGDQIFAHVDPDHSAEPVSTEQDHNAGSTPQD